MTLTLPWWALPVGLILVVGLIGTFWPSRRAYSGVGDAVDGLTRLVIVVFVSMGIWIVTLTARLFQ